MKTFQSILLFLAIIPSAAQADGPLINTWVELRVNSCMPATFEAPQHGPSFYSTGDSYRTALITGTVVDSGLHNYEHLREYRMSEERIRDLAQNIAAGLPRKQSSLSAVLSQWDAEFCRKTQNKVIRFNFNYSCDVASVSGKCLPPLPLLDPVES